eukprot:GHVN01061511.1.p2 GENE.GHVN01061511.1~~GHVN01061511.1.p2  ORF type:complete len:100 (-),score=14.82 GHVN01061511.1:399-698(-)
MRCFQRLASVEVVESILCVNQKNPASFTFHLLKHVCNCVNSPLPDLAHAPLSTASLQGPRCLRNHSTSALLSCLTLKSLTQTPHNIRTNTPNHSHNDHE